MKKFGIILALFVVLGVGAGVYSQNTSSAVSNAAPYSSVQYTSVNALDVVASPFKYLHRNIKIRAKFDKFSTLGLDYPAALRPSDKYISILIQRPDVTNHNIPLSEMKIFLKKELAEKNINLDAGDEIELTGRVFSTALGDAWIDADNLKVITKKNPPKKEENVIE
jgi:lysyl-tRNA synthetase class II